MSEIRVFGPNNLSPALPVRVQTIRHRLFTTTRNFNLIARFHGQALALRPEGKIDKAISDPMRSDRFLAR